MSFNHHHFTKPFTSSLQALEAMQKEHVDATASPSLKQTGLINKSLQSIYTILGAEESSSFQLLEHAAEEVIYSRYFDSRKTDKPLTILSTPIEEATRITLFRKLEVPIHSFVNLPCGDNRDAVVF